MWASDQDTNGPGMEGGSGHCKQPRLSKMLKDILRINNPAKQ